jgi:hypothetical protein
MTMPRPSRVYVKSSNWPPKDTIVSKEGHKENSWKNAAACLCSLSYLAFFRPAADRTDSVFSWVNSRGSLG